MSLETLENILKLFLEDLSKRVEEFGETSHLRSSHHILAEFRNLIRLCSKQLPEHDEYFTHIYDSVDAIFPIFTLRDAHSTVVHISRILEIQESSESKIKEMKVFESANDKLEQAVITFRKDDYTSTFHNLNTALELVLKDRLGIPVTITNINTLRIIDILVKHRIQPYPYLSEAKKRIVMIDNKAKHQGYSPSKIDCINDIKVMEELISRLRDKEIRLTEDIRNKIYEGL